MGMYNYIGTSGDQVKCFYVPCIPVSKDSLGVYNASFGTSGGRLISVNEAPYMTPFYNYGKNIAIIDYPLMWDRENTIVHIIRDGNWVETIKVEDMGDDYNLPECVIDGYGSRFLIDSVPSLRQFLVDADVASKGYDSAYNNALEEANLARFPSIDEWRQLTHEEVQARHDFYMAAMNEAYNVHQKPFHDKWYDVSHESELDILGLAFADYLESLHNEGYVRHEFEWHIVFSDAISRLCNEYEDPVSAYVDWCAKEGIDESVVDEGVLREVVARYAAEPSKELFEDYERMKAERGW